MEENRQKQCTQESIPDFEAIMQEPAFASAMDRRVSEAVEAARGEWEQETQRQVQQARAEAETLARMSSDERAEHDLAQRSAQLDAREQAILGRELRAEAARLLQSRSLPAGLVEIVNCASAEGMQASVNALEQAFRAAVQQGVEARLCGSAPAGVRGQVQESDRSDEDYYRAHYASGRK